MSDGNPPQGTPPEALSGLEERLAAIRLAFETSALPDTYAFTCPSCNQPCSCASVFGPKTIDGLLEKLREKLHDGRDPVVKLKDKKHTACSIDAERQFDIHFIVRDDNTFDISIVPHPPAALDDGGLGDADEKLAVERRALLERLFGDFGKDDASAYHCPYCNKDVPIVLEGEVLREIIDHFIEDFPAQGEATVLALKTYLHPGCGAGMDLDLVGSVGLVLTFDGEKITIEVNDPIKVMRDRHAVEVAALRSDVSGFRDALGSAHTVLVEPADGARPAPAPADGGAGEIPPIHVLNTAEALQFAGEVAGQVRVVRRELEEARAGKSAAEGERDAVQLERDAALESLRGNFRWRLAAVIPTVFVVGIAVGGALGLIRGSSGTDSEKKTTEPSAEVSEKPPVYTARVAVQIDFPLRDTPMLGNPVDAYVVFSRDGSRAKILSQEFSGPPTQVEGGKWKRPVRFVLRHEQTGEKMIAFGTVTCKPGEEGQYDVDIEVDEE